MNFIKINSLWSLDNISDKYSICVEDHKVYNTQTGKECRLYEDFQGYAVLYLSTQGDTEHFKAVFYHKVLALAFINNGPYELIEHLDDDRTNNDISNLAFSDHRQNGLSAFKNGKHIHKSSIFEFCLEDGTVYRGTIRDISKESGISEGTLYDRIYIDRPCISNRTKYRFKYIRELKYGTTRGYNAAHDKLNTHGLSS